MPNPSNNKLSLRQYVMKQNTQKTVINSFTLPHAIAPDTKSIRLSPKTRKLPDLFHLKEEV